MTDPTLAPADPPEATARPDYDPSTIDSNKYRTLVIDSGPIIKLTGVSSLRQRADTFYTVPAVIAEIRDARARQHLQQLPFEIKTREPSPASIHAVTEFARLTGDYQSLSRVDLQVLGLLYELEQEGCGTVEHVRTTPKRTVGVGKIEVLGEKKKQQTTTDGETKEAKEEDVDDIEYDEVNESDVGEEEEEPKKSFFEEAPENPVPKTTTSTAPASGSTKPKTWAVLVSPTQASPAPPKVVENEQVKIADSAVHVSFGNMNICNDSTNNKDDGQFSDAEENAVENNDKEEQKDEEGEELALQKELQSDFPSLAASLHVSYEGDDYEINNDNNQDNRNTDELKEEERKQQALRPVTKSGKLYNSFRGYGKLFKNTKKPVKKEEKNEDDSAKDNELKSTAEETEDETKEGQSRIMGGMTMAGQGVDVEDDGEDWITCTRDIRSLQAAGTLAPPKNPGDEAKSKPGPPLHQRTACATTDFAMQNVILQMGLELLSVDGVKIRRLKNWVMRCGACFKIYTKNDDTGPHGMKRMFCERCGSDMLQRIAASVDGKTGRLRLHMSKKYKKNTRGTKFSLPKPGTVGHTPCFMK
mgnify:CR=1 FL=1